MSMVKTLDNLLNYLTDSNILLNYLKTNINYYYNDLTSIKNITDDFAKNKNRYSLFPANYSNINLDNTIDQIKIKSIIYDSPDIIKQTIDGELAQYYNTYDIINNNYINNYIGLKLINFSNSSDILNPLKYNLNNISNINHFYNECQHGDITGSNISDDYLYYLVKFSFIYTYLENFTNFTTSNITFIKNNKNFVRENVITNFSNFIENNKSDIIYKYSYYILTIIFKIINPSKVLLNLVYSFIDNMLSNLILKFDTFFNRTIYKKYMSDFYIHVQNYINLNSAKILTNSINFNQDYFEYLSNWSNNSESIDYSLYKTDFLPLFKNQTKLNEYLKISYLYRLYPAKFINILQLVLLEYSEKEVFVNNDIQDFSKSINLVFDFINNNIEDVTFDDIQIEDIYNTLFTNNNILQASIFSGLDLIDLFIDNNDIQNFLYENLISLKDCLLQNGYSITESDLYMNSLDYIKLFFRSTLKSGLVNNSVFNVFSDYSYLDMYNLKTNYTQSNIIYNNSELYKISDYMYRVFVPCESLIYFKINNNVISNSNDSPYKCVKINNILYFQTLPDSSKTVYYVLDDQLYLASRYGNTYIVDPNCKDIIIDDQSVLSPFIFKNNFIYLNDINNVIPDFDCELAISSSNIYSENIERFDYGYIYYTTYNYLDITVSIYNTEQVDVSSNYTIETLEGSNIINIIPEVDSNYRISVSYTIDTPEQYINFDNIINNFNSYNMNSLNKTNLNKFTNQIFQTELTTEFIDKFINYFKK